MNQHQSDLENDLPHREQCLHNPNNNELIVYRKNNNNILWDYEDESLSEQDEFDLSKYDSSNESDRFRKKIIHKRKKQEESIQLKKRPLNVLRKAGMIVLSREINTEICFMLLGDLFIHKGIFIDSRDNVMSNTCPVSIYRPVLSTQRTDKYCLAFVENSSSGIVDLTFPIDLLNKLNCSKAKFVAEKMTQLLTFYASVGVLQTKVNIYYNNDKNKIESLLTKNHLKSLEIAKNYLSRLTQEKIVMFHYKKIDPVTLTHKLYYTGSNLTMSELFTGRSDFELMEQYLNRIGTPRYIDSAGMVNLTIAKFSGNTTFDLHLITLDDLVIPLNCSIKRIFLQEFEIIPREKMSEYLDIHILDANLNIIQDVLAKRKVPMSLSTVSQLEYEMKAEMFVQKFYEDEITSKEARE